MQKPEKLKIILATSVWVSLLIGGLIYHTNYTYSAGEAADNQYSIPKNSQIKLHSSLPTLIMFAHPHCPCSKASLSQLSKIILRYKGKFQTKVLFYLPKTFNLTWAQTELWKFAKRLPNTEVKVDYEGIEAQALGAKVSGQTFLYTPNNKLVFSGGFTHGRGHEGENPGVKAITDIIKFYKPEKETSIVKVAVYGCSLFSKGDTNASR